MDDRRSLDWTGLGLLWSFMGGWVGFQLMRYLFGGSALSGCFHLPVRRARFCGVWAKFMEYEIVSLD